MKTLFNMRLSNEVRDRLVAEFYNGKANGSWKTYDEMMRVLLGMNKGLSI